MSSTSANAKAGPSSSTMVAPATTTTTKGKGKLVEGKSEKETAKSSGEEVKNQNVFKNDGSFLGKFQKPKELAPEDKKAQAVAQAKAFEDRFKKRGKRPPPTAEDESGSSGRYKKPKVELTEYEKEVQKYESRMLKDTGSGVRAIMK